MPRSESNAIYSSARGWKNGSNVSARNPITKAASAAETIAASMVRRAGLWLYACQDKFKPNAPALIGLAIAIAMWGFGYRLSSYQLNPTTTGRAAAAKMCVEPRNASLVAVFRVKNNAHLISSSPALTASIPQLHRIDVGIACALPKRTRRRASFGFLIPFRSPPPYSFSPA